MGRPRRRFPRLYAAASLKLHPSTPNRHRCFRFPRLYAAASLKLQPRRAPGALGLFSAALCRGLIEAQELTSSVALYGSGFPRLYAAASLKLQSTHCPSPSSLSFPRLYVAASLKLPRLGALRACGGGFRRLYAAASCRGVVEAVPAPRVWSPLSEPTACHPQTVRNAIPARVTQAKGCTPTPPRSPASPRAGSRGAPAAFLPGRSAP